MISLFKEKIRKALGIEAETDFFSQAGEDAIVWNTFLYRVPKKRGTYVDIGAYHPIKYSNTYLLYKAGWRGINVDPRPGSKALFDRYRAADINVEAGIASAEGSMTYYFISEDSTVNTFSKDNLDRLGMLDQVTKTFEVPVLTLASLLDRHQNVQEVDYLNIDAEGFELEILGGLDDTKIRPTVISLEQNGVFALSDVFETEAYRFLSERRYVPFAKNLVVRDVSTVFYILT